MCNLNAYYIGSKEILTQFKIKYVQFKMIIHLLFVFNKFDI